MNAGTVTREQIFAALFAKWSTSSKFVTVSRRWKHFQNVPAESCPAGFQTQGKQRAEKKLGLPIKWLLRVDIHLYVCVDGEDVTPASQLNDLVDAIEAALAPHPATRVQDLGGLVTDCYISGEAETDEGLLAPQGIAIIPVEIIVPA